MRKISDRGRIRNRLKKLHLEILCLKRDNYCQICGQYRPRLDMARFHILTVAAHPKLEFVDENVLLYARSHWWQCHEPYHRDRDSKLGKKIMARIIELWGADYEQKLLERERYVGRIDKLYLLALEESFKKELEALCGEKRF